MIRKVVANDAQQIAEIHVQSWKESWLGILNQDVLDT